MPYNNKPNTSHFSFSRAPETYSPISLTSPAHDNSIKASSLDFRSYISSFASAMFFLSLLLS